MRDEVKELRILAQRLRNGAQPTDVLGMPPAGIVSATIRVRDVPECRVAHRSPRMRRDVHSIKSKSMMSAMRILRSTGPKPLDAVSGARGGPSLSTSRARGALSSLAAGLAAAVGTY